MIGFGDQSLTSPGAQKKGRSQPRIQSEGYDKNPAHHIGHAEQVERSTNWSKCHVGIATPRAGFA